MPSVRDRKVRVVVADDHAAVRESLILLAEDYGLRVIGEAANGQEAVRQCRRLCPEILLLDISMPVMNGLDAARQISRDCPATKIVFLSGHGSREYAEEALRVGGVAFVSKRDAATCLLEAIDAALSGRTYISHRPAA